ncbi:hemerythrin family protein [Dasania marina]|uniref:hemerythrin family protein n=1 Tax=Dasania marina TaxID=471499 RepID=UPI0030D90B64|tara:strand:+ start:3215 stop:3580 length:366 start_codon:yes stop_codon:yes gene_type:complete
MKETSAILWQDTQHQQLFGLIDLIKSAHDDISIFARLHDYAENHFYLEEQYMARLSYPHIEAHIRAHNKFRQQLSNIAADRTLYDQHVRDALSLFLTEWLTRHIFGIDKQLEQFILDSKIK